MDGEYAVYIYTPGGRLHCIYTFTGSEAEKAAHHLIKLLEKHGHAVIERLPKKP